MIAGLESPDSVDIFIDGIRVNKIKASQRGIGFVFQNYALFRYMTVFDNIAFGLKTQKMGSDKIKNRVKELLKLIDMEGLEKRYPAQLSGGQKQRVAFARALAPNPRLLLLDEPFAAIDAKVRRELRAWLRNMINSLGITSIFVTHDQAEAIEVADLIIVTNQGQVEQRGAPIDLYRQPATPFVAKFIGESTVLENYGSLIGFENAPSGTSCAIRPEFIEIFKDDDEILYPNSVENGIVEHLAFRGSTIEVGLRVKNFYLVTNYSLEKKNISVGDRVKIIIYRLYAFRGDEAVLVNNNRLTDYGNGYNFVI
jgi:sulfate transport system ATP-binding protein